MVPPQFMVELPTELGMVAHEQLSSAHAPSPRAVNHQDAFADIAAFVASFAANAAVLVTLSQTPSTVRALAVLIAERRRPRGAAFWLNVRGPGGQASIELTEAMSVEVVTGLLQAVWEISDESEDESPDKDV